MEALGTRGGAPWEPLGGASGEPDPEFLARLAVVIAARGLRQVRSLIEGGLQAWKEHFAGLSADKKQEVVELARELADRDMKLLVAGDECWPAQLSDLSAAPPYLFAYGNVALLSEPAVGLCGSRGASQRGLEAARYCGEVVAERGWHVVSGYARGVDSETHVAALRAGAGTVIVLAEGILRFRRKKIFSEVPFDESAILALSQFPPTQRWTAGAAMARNALIVGLGRALVVIEAGEKGGTLDAGRKGLQLARNVFALEFADGPRPGNRVLVSEGAVPLATRGELREALDALGRVAQAP